MNFSKYTHGVKYPSSRDFVMVWYYRDGEVVATRKGRGDIVSADGEVLAEPPAGSVKQEKLDDEAFSAAKREWQEAEHRVSEAFVADLFEDFGVADNPRRHQLYRIAYERGHSGGWSDVYSVFADMVELILPLKEAARG